MAHLIIILFLKCLQMLNFPLLSKTLLFCFEISYVRNNFILFKWHLAVASKAAWCWIWVCYNMNSFCSSISLKALFTVKQAYTCNINEEWHSPSSWVHVMNPLNSQKREISLFRVALHEDDLAFHSQAVSTQVNVYVGSWTESWFQHLRAEECHSAASKAEHYSFFVAHCQHQ